jgi:dephospho-CoA kinase
MLKFSQYISEGVNDPAIFKAIFLAGGPGSGKSFIVGQTALTALGMRVVNSDDAFENAMKKAGMEMNPENIFSVKGQEMRGRAKTLTGKKQELYLKGRLGIVIDGTGREYDKIKTQSVQLQRLGYDTAMIFVNTDKETALARNRARTRSLPDDEVAKMWQAVQNNIGKFNGHFGRNFIVLDNSNGANWKAGTQQGYKWARKFVDKIPTKPVAKKWIANEKNR